MHGVRAPCGRASRRRARLRPAAPPTAAQSARGCGGTLVNARLCARRLWTPRHLAGGVSAAGPARCRRARRGAPPEVGLGRRERAERRTGAARGGGPGLGLAAAAPRELQPGGDSGLQAARQVCVGSRFGLGAGQCRAARQALGLARQPGRQRRGNLAERRRRVRVTGRLRGAVRAARCARQRPGAIGAARACGARSRARRGPAAHAVGRLRGSPRRVRRQRGPRSRRQAVDRDVGRAHGGAAGGLAGRRCDAGAVRGADRRRRRGCARVAQQLHGRQHRPGRRVQRRYGSQQRARRRRAPRAPQRGRRRHHGHPRQAAIAEAGAAARRRQRAVRIRVPGRLGGLPRGMHGRLRRAVPGALPGLDVRPGRRAVPAAGVAIGGTCTCLPRPDACAGGGRPPARRDGSPRRRLEPAGRARKAAERVGDGRRGRRRRRRARRGRAAGRRPGRRPGRRARRRARLAACAAGAAGRVGAAWRYTPRRQRAPLLRRPAAGGAPSVIRHCPLCATTPPGRPRDRPPARQGTQHSPLSHSWGGPEGRY